MIKHVGRHNNKKVVIIFRQLQDMNQHMALVLYTDTLAANYHDDLMKVLESPVGQQAKDFADALHRSVFNDGRNMLQTLHSNGWLKKVQSSQVIVEASPKSHVRLDELNDIINKLEQGGEAAQQLKELDAQAGLYDPAKAIKEPTDVIADASVVNETEVPIAPMSDGVLTDEIIAQNTLQQAEQMEAQVKQLEAEAKRLREEAYTMAPSLKPKRKYTRKKAPAKGKKVA